MCGKDNPGMIIAYFYTQVGKGEADHPRLWWKDQLLRLRMRVYCQILVMDAKKKIVHSIVNNWNEHLVRCFTFLLFIIPIKPNKLKIVQIWHEKKEGALI